MKSLLTMLLTLLLVNISFAQMTKEEEKEWKKKLKTLSAEEYKQLLETKTKLEEEKQKAEEQASKLEAEKKELENQVAKQKAELEKQTAQASEQKKDETNYSTEYQQPVSKGVVYKVQIGAFKNFDLSKYFNNHSNFSGEVDENGIMRYTLGQFTDYWEADKFKKYLREMGVKGAWIVAYKNGKRVNIKDALEGAI